MCSTESFCLLDHAAWLITLLALQVKKITPLKLVNPVKSCNPDARYMTAAPVCTLPPNPPPALPHWPTTTAPQLLACRSFRLKKVAPVSGTKPASTLAGKRVGTRLSNQSRAAMQSTAGVQVGLGRGGEGRVGRGPVGCSGLDRMPAAACQFAVSTLKMGKLWMRAWNTCIAHLGAKGPLDNRCQFLQMQVGLPLHLPLFRFMMFLNSWRSASSGTPHTSFCMPAGRSVLGVHVWVALFRGLEREKGRENRGAAGLHTRLGRVCITCAGLRQQQRASP